MKRVIMPRNLSGSLRLPPSKSLSHRAIIAASIANGVSKIDNVMYSDDIIATLDIMEEFGAKIQRGKDTLIIEGTQNFKLPNRPLDCKESGSTLRFLIPFGLMVDGECEFVGRGKLVTRPIETYIEILKKQNIDYEYSGKLPLKLNGKIKADEFIVPGNISSQFITGLLFVLPMLEKDSKIIIQGKLESKGYIDLTIDMLSLYGVTIDHDNYEEFYIKGNQTYQSRDYCIEGDYSQLAFWIVAGTIGERIEIDNIRENSLQGDKKVIDIVQSMGGNLRFEGDRLIVEPAHTKGVTIDASQCPDIIPVLCVLGALSDGETRIINGDRLRIKESDRIKATIDIIEKLGGFAVETSDGMIIKGNSKFHGCELDSWNDHRIAMAGAIGGIRARGKVSISRSGAINKSYPSFFQDYEKLGGKIYGEYL